MNKQRQQRFNDVYKDCSSDEEDSDYEMSNYSNINQNRREGGKYSENKQYQSNLMKRRTGQNLKYSSSDYGKISCETGRRPKVFNKNALMARENRMKKKMYVQNLEENVDSLKDENKKLSSILDNQSTVISDLRKEVKYLKNVLANSTDISRLLKSINENTGMPVATSINHNIKLKAKEVINDHPWAENTKSRLNSLDYFNFDDSNDMETINDVCTPPSQLTEHNYTSTNSSSITDSEDSGVCLHITGHKVSLEFCASCSENASTVWNKD